MLLAAGIESGMKNPKSRIQELCSEALSATSAGQIDPILTELRTALHQKVMAEESWVELCERAAVEQDATKLLELVTEINRRFKEREEDTPDLPHPRAEPEPEV